MMVTWLKRGSKICLALLSGSSHRCARERRALRGRLPPALKYLVESAQSSLT